MNILKGDSDVECHTLLHYGVIGAINCQRILLEQEPNTETKV